MAEIGRGRVRLIHTLRAELGMADDAYQDMLSVGFGVTTCLDLTIPQADMLIAQLRRALEHGAVKRLRSDARTAVEYASAPMQRRLTFHSIRCAIHYIRAEDLKAWSDPDGDGAVLTGEELRRWIAQRWEEGVHRGDEYRRVDTPIPPVILGRLYHKWINPNTNKYLVEGGFKKRSITPERCYYAQLSSQAVHYLIDRYRELHAAIDRRDQRMQVPL